jgi:hypothetical protein
MKTTKITTITLFLVLMATVTTSFAKEPIFTCTVKINYGVAKTSRDTTIMADHMLTALEVLQYAAVIETHPVGHYVFVTSIDGVHGERGLTAWYYKVNGQSTKTLAINNVLKSGDVMEWDYQKDVCSCTVDNKGCNKK